MFGVLCFVFRSGGEMQFMEIFELKLSYTLRRQVRP